MTHADPSPSKTLPGTAPSPRFHWIWQSLSLAVSLGLAAGVLAILVFEPFHSADEENAAPRDNDKVLAAQLTPAGALHIKPGSSLESKLTIETAQLKEVTTPLLTVTGSVAARLGPGPDSAEARWDFVSAELASAYVDWLKARDEVVFADKQFVSIRDLSEARLKAQTKVVERLVKLVAAGTDSEKDLAAAEADLVQTRIQGQKDTHEAETAKKNAVRNGATLERQLYQAGVDPELLVAAKDNLAVVVAEVPEAKVALVTKGQKCEARFYAFPDDLAQGRVGSVSPTLSKERRTLRVFFELQDPKGRLRPGMFAEVYLGTEPRKVLLIPTAAVVHVGKADYIFAGGKEPGDWEIVKISLGEVHGTWVEVLSRLQNGTRVVGQGAVLLKPYLVELLSRNKIEDSLP